MSGDPYCGCGEMASQHVGPDGACICCRCPAFHEDHTIVEALVCAHWPLRLPDYRAYRWSRAWHEAARLHAMYSVIRDGDTVYEIGAEEGDYGALFTTWGAKVVIVEPAEKCWPSIRASFEANNVRPYAWVRGFLADHAWKTDTNHDVALGRSGWPEEADGDLIAEHGFFHLGEHAGVAAATTLDALAKRIAAPPDVISIDVEGGELHVLRGAAGVLAELHPIVFVSVHEAFLRDLYDIDAADIYTFMADLGYRATELAVDHERHVCFDHPEGRQL